MTSYKENILEVKAVIWGRTKAIANVNKLRTTHLIEVEDAFENNVKRYVKNK